MKLRIVNPISLFFVLMWRLILGSMHIMAKMIIELFKFMLLMWKILLIGTFSTVKKMVGRTRVKFHKVQNLKRSEV